jgi:hypothetical protein
MSTSSTSKTGRTRVRMVVDTISNHRSGRRHIEAFSAPADHKSGPTVTLKVTIEAHSSVLPYRQGEFFSLDFHPAEPET